MAGGSGKRVHWPASSLFLGLQSGLQTANQSQAEAFEQLRRTCWQKVCLTRQARCRLCDQTLCLLPSDGPSKWSFTCSSPVGKTRPSTTTKLFSVKRPVVTLSFVTCDRSRSMCVLESSKKKRPSSSWEMNPSTYFVPLLPTSDCSGVNCRDGERKYSQFCRRKGTKSRTLEKTNCVLIVLVRQVHIRRLRRQGV
jgi:hypothetical protein